jgi:hypothetical protein
LYIRHNVLHLTHPSLTQSCAINDEEFAASLTSPSITYEDDVTNSSEAPLSPNSTYGGSENAPSGCDDDDVMLDRRGNTRSRLRSFSTENYAVALRKVGYAFNVEWLSLLRPNSVFHSALHHSVHSTPFYSTLRSVALPYPPAPYALFYPIPAASLCCSIFCSILL